MPEDEILRLLLISHSLQFLFSLFFFFNDTATTEIYTLSLHDALPISLELLFGVAQVLLGDVLLGPHRLLVLGEDRKSTRLNSSHGYISYAVFCLKKKKQTDMEWSVSAARDEIVAVRTLLQLSIGIPLL